jgi:hypothetical protein
MRFGPRLWHFDEDSLPVFETMRSDISGSPPSEKEDNNDRDTHKEDQDDGDTHIFDQYDGDTHEEDQDDRDTLTSLGNGSEQPVAVVMQGEQVRKIASSSARPIMKISYATLSQKCTELTNVAASLPEKKKEQILGAIIALTDIARGGNSGIGTGTSLEEVVAFAQQAFDHPGFSAKYQGGNADISQPSGPRPAKAIVGGAPKRKRLEAHVTSILSKPKSSKRAQTKTTCHFCGNAAGHNILSCPLKKDHGKHLVEEELQSLLDSLNAGHGLQNLPEGTLTQDKPLLKVLPPQTKWLVLHKLCFIKFDLSPEASSRSTPTNYGVLVTCLGERGSKLDRRYIRCLVQLSGLRTWIEKSRSINEAKARSLSRVFSTMDHELYVQGGATLSATKVTL